MELASFDSKEKIVNREESAFYTFWRNCPNRLGLPWLCLGIYNFLLGVAAKKVKKKLALCISFLLLSIFYVNHVHSLQLSDCRELTQKKVFGITNFFPMCKRLYNYKTGKASYKPYQIPIVHSQNFQIPQGKIVFYANQFSRGNVILGEVELASNHDQECSVSLISPNKDIDFHKQNKVHSVLFAIDPDFNGHTYSVSLRFRCGKNVRSKTVVLSLRDRAFPVLKVKLQLGKYADRSYLADKPELLQKIAEQNIRINSVWSRLSDPVRQFGVSHPRSVHRVTSSFYMQRSRLVYNQGKLVGSASSRHYGVDLWGDVGEPVFAMLRGRVALAEEMYYQGKYIIIDHGQGVFSEYMHLDAIHVKKDDIVEPGQRIGATGKTGMVMGAHLHIGLRIRGMFADPLSLVGLPIR